MTEEQKQKKKIEATKEAGARMRHVPQLERKPISWPYKYVQYESRECKSSTLEKQVFPSGKSRKT